MRTPPRITAPKWTGFEYFPLILLILFLGLFSHTLLAEGSKDFTTYPGNRLFLDTREAQQFKVYANIGEFINVGASHVGIQGGFIALYRPNGTLHTVFDGSDGRAIIHNHLQEAGGPTGVDDTSNTGYYPGVIAVEAGEAGIWTVDIDFPSFELKQFINLANDAPWTRAGDQPNARRVVLSWDITVSKNEAGNAGGDLVEGRVYSNEYISIVNLNGNSTSPTFFILTKGGFVYEVDFMNTDPFRFPITSNSNGFVNHNQQPTYSSQLRDSVVRSDDPMAWTAGDVYYYEPQAADFASGSLVNNKVFFNLPDPNMPAFALTTDIFRNNPHVTWLFLEPELAEIDIQGFDIEAMSIDNLPCSTNAIEFGVGGFLKFNSTVGGTAVLQLDLNNNGVFTEPTDRQIFQLIDPGASSIFWDGKDGLGNFIPLQEDFMLGYRLEIRGGETHVILSDVENSLGGVSFTLKNNLGVLNPGDFYYDHSSVGGSVSGNGTPGNPLPTNVPYTYQFNFGNNKLLDYWTFVPFPGSAVDVLTIDVVDDCTLFPAPMADSDGDGIDDTIDLDDDNDGIPDLKEYCNATSGGFDCLPGQLDPSADQDGDGILNFRDANDPDIPNMCDDLNNDGICDAININYDTDRDGVADHLDLDSDNDGIPDLVEAGHNQPDVNGNGVIDGLAIEFGANGLFNPIATHPDAFDAEETYLRWDKDEDGIPDHDDLDTDNDGINDVAEVGYAIADTNNDGRIDDGTGNPPNVNINGLPSLIDPDLTGMPIPLPSDKDQDALPDWRDLDADNDAIYDAEEGGNLDPDGDGIIGAGIPFVNGNGVAIFNDIGLPIMTTSHPADTDGDQIPDFQDLDADNDGIHDVTEAGFDDSDNNALPGIGLPMVNQNGVPIADMVGIPITATSQPGDTDTDGVDDYRDLDADNDGINDVIEGGNPDDDADGFIGSGIPQVNNNGLATMDMLGNPLSSTSAPTNTDNDTTPDFQELDSDDDGIMDVIEGSSPDPDTDGIIGVGSPEVNLLGQANLDQNGDPISTTSSPTDSDNDGNPDFQELDSDDDGLMDQDECPDGSNCTDGDLDTIPDFQDPDRDNDGISDAYECENAIPCPDTDNDGIPDIDDLDTDGDNLTDSEECPGGEPCPDSNNNGIPDWREYDCTPDQSAPVISDITGGEYCEGQTISLSATNAIQIPGIITYEWTGPSNFSFIDTASSMGPFPVNIPNAGTNLEGLYTLQLTSEAGCPSNPMSVNVSILPLPTTPELTVNSEALCIGDLLQLSSTVFSGGNVTYEWFFNNGDTDVLFATTTMPTLFIDSLTVDNGGIYSVQVNTGNCLSPRSNSTLINVNNGFAAPMLTSNGDVFCSNQTLELNSSIFPNGGANYEWYFYDGTTEILLSITDVPTIFINNLSSDNSGIYSVQITMGNCTSQRSNLVDININNEITPAPTLSVNSNEFCAGETFELNSSIYSGTNITYEWVFDNGSGLMSSTTTAIPTLVIDDVSLVDEGTYMVIVHSDDCQTAPSNSQLIAINNMLSQTPIVTATNDELCTGETLELNTTPIIGNDVIYEWFFDNGLIVMPIGFTNTPTLFIENMAIANTGNYFVIATSGSCETAPSNTVDIVVNTTLMDTPELTVSQNTLCEGETLELNSSIFSGNNVTYEWFFDNGNGNGPTSFATTISPTLFLNFISIANNSGIYSVVVHIGDCQSAPSNSENVTVSNNLGDAPELSISSDFICVDETLELTSSVYPGVGVTYQWFFNGGNGTTLLNVTSLPALTIGNVTTANSGTYWVLANIGSCQSTPSNVESVEVTTGLDETVELTVNANDFCAGDILELSVTPLQGSNIVYQWFFDDGNGVITFGTTNVPTFFVEDLTTANTGVYLVVAQNGSCVSPPSNGELVTITPNLTETPTLNAANTTLCQGEVLELSSTQFAQNGVSYQWFFDNGNGAILLGTTNTPNFTIENINTSNSGIYTIIGTIGNCDSPTSNVLNIAITPTLNEAPQLSVNNNEVCAGASIELNSSSLPGDVTYEWFFDNGNGAVSLATTNSSIFSIENATVAESGIYTVVATVDVCNVVTSNAVNIEVTNMPTVAILNSTDADSPACLGDMIQFNAPAIPGATYLWTGPFGFSSNVPNPVIPEVTAAQAGEYMVVIQMATCTATSEPTTVFVYNEVTANEDAFEVIINESLDDVSLVANDEFIDVENWMVIPTNQPEHGKLEISNGLMTYIPNQNYFGEDAFTYELCNLDCPGLCEEAEVTIRISGAQPSEECFIPNIITPNEDGVNDLFKIPCFNTDFPNNQVKIFNRWGDEVFQAKPYQNDWGGTYKGTLLPPGTYFYLVWTDADSGECLQGYFTLTR